MPPKTTEDRIRQICIDHLGVTPEKVTSDSNFENDLGADSLDFVEFIMAIEEDFEIEVSDEDAAKIKTVGDAVSYIDSRA